MKLRLIKRLVDLLDYS